MSRHMHSKYSAYIEVEVMQAESSTTLIICRFLPFFQQLRESSICINEHKCILHNSPECMTVTEWLGIMFITHM